METTILSNKNIDFKTDISQFKILAKCVDSYMSEYDTIKYITCGANACVFRLTKKEKGRRDLANYIVKIIIINEQCHICSYDDKKFDNSEIIIAKEEVEFTKLMSEYEISPKFINSWSCVGQVKNTKGEWVDAILYFIVMEQMEITIQQYYNKYGNEVLKYKNSILHLINKLNNLGYLHADLTMNNIMVNIKDQSSKITKITLIDFGSSQSIDKLIDNKNYDIKMFEENWNDMINN